MGFCGMASGNTKKTFYVYELTFEFFTTAQSVGLVNVLDSCRRRVRGLPSIRPTRTHFFCKLGHIFMDNNALFAFWSMGEGSIR